MTAQDSSGTHPTLADSEELSEHQELPRGYNLGRYVIIEPIGSGGMGTVYRAYDPQLNRGVALKILSVKHADLDVGERAKARLIREAQALARLSHPNVVAVHDAGTFEDDVFVTMELVQGKTLDDWLQEEKRSVKDTLEVLIAAGRGLSAAHSAGLIHRDFKPGNVMVDDDGRVRVLDFGLARAADQEESLQDRQEMTDQEGRSHDAKEPLDWKEASLESSSDLLQSPLTHAGGVLGTPLYMAPEQHLGLKTDERTDQFGFCVVLYEALYGKRPFAARSMEELKSQVVRQQVLVPGEDADVPDWLWQIILKGLSTKPQDRYTTIEQLLDALAEDPEEVRRQHRLIRRRKLFMVSLIMLAIALPIGVWYGLRYRTYQLCRNTEGEIAGVWDDTTRISIQKAFLGTKTTYALGTWERVQRTFDSYLAEWTEMRSEVCEAKLLSATLSEDLFDLRMGCLRKRMRELEALVKVFKVADAGVVQKAVQASSLLTTIAICSNDEALRAPYPPPKTAESRSQVATIRKKLAEIEAYSKTGKYQEGLALANKLEKSVDSIDYRPVKAEVLYWLGSLLEKTGEYQKAEDVLHVAVDTASEIKDALLAAKELVILAWVVGYRQARYKDGLLLSRYAKVMLNVAGGDERTMAKLENNLGGLYHRKGDYTKALAYYRKSHQMFERSLGPENPVVAMALNNLGVVYVDNGDLDTAQIYYSKAQAIREKTLGPEHPDVALTLNNLGALFWRKGDYNKAIENLRKALAIKEKALGPKHPGVAYTLDCIGEILLHKGEYDKSKDIFRKSLVILEKAMGPNHPMLAWPLTGIGRVFINQGKPGFALESLERVLRICQQNTCALEPHGHALYSLARADLASGGNKKRAIEMAKKARDIFGKAANKFIKEREEVEVWLAKHGTDQRLTLHKQK